MTDVAMPKAVSARIFPWWATLIQGIAAVIIGALLIFQPLTTTVTLVYFIGWWWLIAGIFELGTLFVDRTAWGWRVFTGLLSIIAGGYIIAAPFLGAAIVVGIATLLLGINGMIIGVVDLIKAFQGDGWGKGVLGAFSFIIGAIIAFNFTSFMLALPWVFGAFALVFGALAVVAAFQQRTAQT
jgi:uncharacterized membrane protein HdeD (DUF308 family)